MLDCCASNLPLVFKPVRFRQNPNCGMAEKDLRDLNNDDDSDGRTDLFPYPKNKKYSKRPIWFMVAYVSVAITIIGIILSVISIIVIIIKKIKFSTKWSSYEPDQNYSYFGANIAISFKAGLIILAVAFLMGLSGWLLFWWSISGIDDYITSMQDELNEQRSKQRKKDIQEEYRNNEYDAFLQ